MALIGGKILNNNYFATSLIFPRQKYSSTHVE